VDKDPYEILGVQQSDSTGEIQKAYRRLAKKLYPDLNPGNPEAEEEFKKVASAYDLLSDPEKRARFDRGEIDASGTERPQHQFYRDYAGAGAEYHPYATNSGYADMMDSDEILSNLFRGARSSRRRQRCPIQTAGRVSCRSERRDEPRDTTRRLRP
jgi:curved DNA-binding protein CbpA